MKRFVSVILTVAMLFTMFTFPVNVGAQQSDWVTLCDDDYNYPSSTVIGTSYGDSLPYKKVSSESQFTPSFSTFGGVNIIKMEYDNATKVNDHKEVRHKFSDTAITEGLIEHRFSVYFPSNVANGSGGTYNSNGATIWEGISNGSTDLVALQFSLSASGYANLTYYGSGYGVSGSVAKNIPFDKWISITTYANINTKTSSTSVSWDGTVQGQCTDVPWNSTSYNPTKLRHYIQKNAVNTLYYISDESVRHLSTQGMANADLNSLSVPSNPESDFTVATTGSVYGNTITWSSSSDALVVNGGNITLGDVANDTEVTLTASITIGGNTYTKNFTVTVPANADSDEASVLNETFDYTPGTAITSKTATNDMPWYIQASDTNNFTASIANDGTDNSLSMSVPSTITDTSNHKSVQRDFSDGSLEGIVNYSFKVKAPVQSGINTSANLWVSVTDSGKCEMTTITHQIRGEKLYAQHVPCTVAASGSSYKEAAVGSGLTFAGGTELTYKISINVNSHTYVLTVTDGVQTYTSEECIIRNYKRGLAGYTGIPAGIRVFFERSNTSALAYVDDIVVTNITSQKMADADFEELVVPSNPTEDFTVASVGSVYGSPITWSSSSAALIVDGTSVALNPQGTAVNAVLTATISLGDKSYTKDFTVTVPKNNDVTGHLNEEFNYTLDTAIGTSTTATMPWKIVSSDSTNFGAVIAGDASNKYLKFSTNSVLNETSNHKSIQRVINAGGVGGIVNYSISVFAPSGVDNGAGGTYNSGGHNLWVSLTDTANREMLTTTAIISGGAVSVQHVPDVTTSGGSYKEAAVKAPITFGMNKWITFDVTLDVAANTYVLSVTDGTQTHTFDKAVVRNLNRGYADYTGIPANIRIFGERGHANTLCYIDNIVVDELSYKYVAKFDAELITVPSQPVVDFTLPVEGGKYGSSITWSSNSAALSVDALGNVTVNPQNTDTTVTLTAAVVNGTHTETKTFEVLVKNEEYLAKEVLNYIMNNLTFKDISGVKEYYVTGDFTPVVNNLPSGVSATFTTNNAAITMNNGVAKVTRGANDTNVNFTVTLTDSNSYSVSKTFDVLVHGNGTVMNHIGFDDETYKDKTISTVPGWSGYDGTVGTDVTGATAFVRFDGDDGHLDTQRYRSYNTNQYSLTNLDSEAIGDAVLQFRAKFTGDENFWWVFYVSGDYVNENGVTEKNQVIAQFSFDTKHFELGQHPSGINGPTPAAAFDSLYEGELPFDRWFNFRTVFHTDDSTYDLYIDDTKITSAPIKAYLYADGKKISRINGIQVGASRNFEWAGNYAVDDIMVRCLADDATLLEKVAQNLAIGGSNIMFDMNLPKTAAFESTVTWSSKNGLVDKDGKVTRGFGLGSDPETLTATVTRNGTSIQKAFDINVIRQPYYETEQVVFTDKDGNDSLVPTPGGKIKNISILENKAVAGAKVYVGVYDIDSLVTAKVYNAADGDIEINYTLPNEDDLTVKAFVWNGDLEPIAHEYAVSTKPKKNFTIYVAGDSICATTNKAANHDPATTQYGWGEVVGQLFDDSYVAVDNHAMGGRSSRSFIDEGRLQNIIEKIQPGDYLFIKFGHNDQKPAEPEKYTTLGEDGTYRKYLQMYVDAARDKGAIPVLVTSIYRRRFSDGVSEDTQCGYPEEMKAYAQTVNVPVIDLHQKTGAWLTQIGETESAKYYMTHAGDNTHLTYNGVVELNRMAKEEMVKLGLPINTYFAQNQ